MTNEGTSNRAAASLAAAQPRRRPPSPPAAVETQRADVRDQEARESLLRAGVGVRKCKRLREMKMNKKKSCDTRAPWQHHHSK